MKIVVTVGDTHINSTVGLCAPSVVLDDGNQTALSPAQSWLWDCWRDFADQIDHEARVNRADVTVILNGDTVDGDTKQRSTQVITRNPADIVTLAGNALQPLLVLAHQVFVIRGTGAHGGASGCLEELVARDIGAVKDGEQFSRWSLLAEFGGVLFDVAHHGPLGRLPWNKAAPLGTLAIRLALDYANRRLPALAIRSHNHRTADSYDNYPVRVIALPAWQLATEYAHRTGCIEPADIGGAWFMCENGEYECQKKIYKPRPRQIWTADLTKATS